MSEKIEPIRHKLTEAIPDPKDHPANPIDSGGPPPPVDPAIDVKLHNAEVHPSRKEHMVDIGRGEQTKGRGPS